MKHGEIVGIAHNAAHSLASGICFMIGVYGVEVFAEARWSPGGSLTADFLHGRISEGEGSPWLAEAVRLYRAAVAERVARHGATLEEDVREMTVRFWSGGAGPRFAVTVEDAAGRRSTTEYEAWPGKRVMIVDGLGRIRRKPGRRSAAAADAAPGNA